MTMHPAPAAGSRPLDVISRTFNCEGTLPAVLAAIGASEGIRHHYLMVDNSSTDRTRERFPPCAVVIEYSLPGFNYAMAINIAIPRLVSEYVLVISSHVVIENPLAIRRVIEAMDSHSSLGGVCFSSYDHGEMRTQFVTRTSFNGLNGLWNSCSHHRSSLLRERPFNPDVYSAEDQECSR